MFAQCDRQLFVYLEKLCVSVKFYCFRHSKPEMRLGRGKRKRGFEDDTPKVSNNIKRRSGLCDLVTIAKLTL